MIQGIIFDFGGVLCTFDSRLFFQALAGRTDRTAGEMAALVLASDLPRRYESGQISSREFFTAVTKPCGLSMSEEEFIAEFTGIFLPIESTFRLIRALKPAFRIALLSNTNEWHFEHYIRTVEVFPLFDAVTLSYRVGEMKPGERIYRDSLRRIGLPPEKCVFIDDLEENVAGGGAARHPRDPLHGPRTARRLPAGSRHPRRDPPAVAEGTGNGRRTRDGEDPASGRRRGPPIV